MSAATAFAAGLILGIAAALAVAVGLALVLEVDRWEGSWEDPLYHQGPTDPPESHLGDGSDEP